MSNPLLSTPARWNVDPSATHARFLSSTLWGLIPVRGSLTARSGHLLVEPPDASGELLLDAASVDTRLRLRNFHLRTRDYFNSARHPDVRFLAHTLTPAGPDQISVEGELTVAGHTAPVTLECSTRPQGPDRIELAGEAHVDRRSFRMSGGQLPGLIPVGVELSLTVVLERDSTS